MREGACRDPALDWLLDGDPLEEAQRRGREFLLVHRLFRSHRTGAVIKPAMLQFSFPPRWHYDVLRALDHFQAAGAPRDERLAEAIDLVRKKRRKDGRWALENVHRGQTFFALERPGGPSRWNTLRARRVLAWWDAAPRFWHEPRTVAPCAARVRP